jgi:hypothetical protein
MLQDNNVIFVIAVAFVNGAHTTLPVQLHGSLRMF